MRKSTEAEKGKSSQVTKSDAEWRQSLTPEQFHVTREHGTERAFSHPYSKEKREGMYRCVCCGAPLFSSDAKFDLRHRLAKFHRRQRLGDHPRGHLARHAAH